MIIEASIDRKSWTRLKDINELEGFLETVLPKWDVILRKGA